MKAQETEDIRASKEGQPAECGSSVTCGIGDCTLGLLCTRSGVHLGDGDAVP